ncbi:hypothetical protein ACWGJ2_16125 [Streptomyces sp. NPDC054796]
MEAGPRDNEETTVGAPRDPRDARENRDPRDDSRDPQGVVGPRDAAEPERRNDPPLPEGPGAPGTPGTDVPDVSGADDPEPDDPDPDGAVPSDAAAPVEPHELRPQRKLRLWQLAPIVVLGALGSLMFAFPLAFEPGGGSGAVVSMLGLLICGCAAGWGVMAARRVGQSWPGLPARGSGQRTDWRVVVLYAVVVGTVVALAIWRVARLR